MTTHNVATVTGNITDDVDLRFTPSGHAVANFTVAVNSRKKSGDEWEEVLDGFFRCTAWRDLAENCAESLAKGDRVVVVGKLQQQTWEDKDGGKRSRVELQVDEVAVSLRWATAKPQKVKRGQGSSGGDWGASAPPPAALVEEEGGF